MRVAAERAGCAKRKVTTLDPAPSTLQKADGPS